MFTHLSSPRMCCVSALSKHRSAWQRQHARTTLVLAPGATSSSPSASPFDIPPNAVAATEQVQSAICAAYRRGSDRQLVNALLPLIGATDLDDWPGGIRQMFKAALPMVESLNRSLRSNLGLDGKLETKILDRGDAVGAWYNDKLLVVLFPTGDVISQVQELTKGKSLVVMINAQWAPGQVVSDFGLFGRRKKEDFVKSFETTYSFQTRRMCGEDIRLMLMDGKTQLFVQEGDRFTFVKEFDGAPSYSELEATLKGREGSMASRSLAERMQAQVAFNSDSLKSPPGR